MTVFIITLLILIYLYLGLVFTNRSIDILNNIYERILLTLFWIIIIPICFINEIIIKGKKI